MCSELTCRYFNSLRAAFSAILRAANVLRSDGSKFLGGEVPCRQTEVRQSRRHASVTADSRRERPVGISDMGQMSLQ